MIRWNTNKTAVTSLFQNNYQQDDTYGLSFISGLVVLHSTCFELQGAHHQEFNFLLYRQPLAYCVHYSKKLYSMPEAACTEKKKWNPDDELPEARNM